MLSSSSALRVVIPARYGSERFPGKPLIDLCGKPMVVRVYESVRAALPTTDTIVATDDARIASVLDEEKIPRMLTRADHESGSDRVAEVARKCQWSGQDILINVQGDEPLIPIELISAFARFCESKSDLSMATLAVPFKTTAQIQDPHAVKLILNSQDRAAAFSRAALPFNRDLPESQWPLEDYLRHVGIYAYRNSELQRLTRTPPCMLERAEKLEQLRALWLGIPIDVLRWNEPPPNGVDTPEDIARIIHSIKKKKGDECRS